jgi:cytochrome c-type biogenesis protein CcsB
MSFGVNITFFKIATLSYLFAMVFYLAYLAFKSKTVGKVASGITYFGFLAHTASIGIRWWESYQMGADIGHIPVSNLFESMSFGAWTIILIYCLVEWKYKNRTFGAFVMPVAFLAMTYIFVAPNISKDIEPLVPALKSYWLHIHVITSFLGYAAFAISFGVSLMYLIINTKEKDATYAFWTLCIGLLIAVMIALGVDAAVLGINPGKEGKHMLEGTFRNPALAIRLLSFVGLAAIMFASWLLGIKIKDKLMGFANTSETLDEVGYKTIAIGFPLLTVGIITGAVWANSAWGTYWGWDPKETWSLITWLVYAAYLHARYTRGWRGKRAAILSMVGFLAVIFTYLGVNLLLSGLHSYGSAD